VLDYTLAEVASAVRGELAAGSADARVLSAAIDSRAVDAGALFFALPGERVDGHEFVAQAVTAGASGAVVSTTRPRDSFGDLPEAFGLIMVDDPARALARLAGWHRRLMKASVVGVTGSAGKTTTKDMIAAVLAESFSVLATEGNMNNEIGLPLTLLRLQPGHDVAVLEMAMRAPGEIAALAETARPDVGVVTNVGYAHIGLLGSQSAIADAKAELVRALPAHGFAVLNGEDPRVRAIERFAPGRSLLYGLSPECSVRAVDVALSEDDTSFAVALDGQAVPDVRFTVPVPGRHNVLNGLAALAVGWRLGIEPEAMARGLASFRPSAMRMHFVKASGGFTLIDDTYNANPASVRCAIDAALQHAGQRRVIAILGDMLELGDSAAAGHAELGEYAASAGVSGLVTVGSLAALAAQGAVRAGLDPRRCRACDDNVSAARAATEMADADDVILVKGSRGMRMEQIVSALAESPDDSGDR
jgi:UDP-N-acetylmuramoyl-tripeptide--D-alanyl-D-alanine ligase